MRIAYYPERTSAVKGEDIYSRTAGKTDKALTKSAESGIIVTGVVEDNFSRKAQITEYTDDLAKTNPNKILPYKTRQDIETAMHKMGDGARVEIRIVWEKNEEGHVFCAEQINGRTVFVDPQTGNGDCSNYFELMKKGLYYFWRIDNLRPSDLMIDCCE